MFKQSFLVITLIFILLNFPVWCQEESPPKIELSKKTFGINLGTGFFQNVKLDLVNFKQEIVTTSDNLIPIHLKANFNYYFTPNLALRFSSGYGFLQQQEKIEMDFGLIDSMDVKLNDKANFSVTGFPAEAALIFQTPLDARAIMFFHSGIGLGYYVYNYKAEGISRELTSKTSTQQKKENYLNPETTLSGGAQFFIVGINILINPKIGATLEVSKIGWNFMKLTRDITKQETDRGKIINEKKYGYRQEDYTMSNGFDDIAITFGIYWNL